MEYTIASYLILKAMYRASEKISEKLEEEWDDTLNSDLNWINTQIMHMERVDDAVNALVEDGWIPQNMETEEM